MMFEVVYLSQASYQLFAFVLRFNRQLVSI